MELKAVKNETKKEYLTKKEQYQKIKNKAGKIGIGTILMFMASNTSYALPVDVTNITPLAGDMPIGIPPVWFRVTHLLLRLARIISLIITLIEVIVSRKKEDAKKKIKKDIIITAVIFVVAVIFDIVCALLRNQMWW